jgi:hypothetical protein
MNTWIIKIQQNKAKEIITKRNIINFLKSVLPKDNRKPIDSVEYLHSMIAAEIRYSILEENDGKLSQIIKHCDQEHINLWNLARDAVNETKEEKYYNMKNLY